MATTQPGRERNDRPDRDHRHGNGTPPMLIESGKAVCALAARPEDAQRDKDGSHRESDASQAARILRPMTSGHPRTRRSGSETLARQSGPARGRVARGRAASRQVLDAPSRRAPTQTVGSQSMKPASIRLAVRWSTGCQPARVVATPRSNRRRLTSRPVAQRASRLRRRGRPARGLH
jgi:hypothetical protein